MKYASPYLYDSSPPIAHFIKALIHICAKHVCFTKSNMVGWDRRFGQGGGSSTVERWQMDVERDTNGAREEV